ncbi:polyhydroxyalkanoate synthesis repressor PhaR [Erythrobacteraceae bacterium CFH 75059]|uniref:polyhydroxyalkanoate synthesis repressor PhaR n=1 Tax=Qipengyuania thermophila TaxID=2509361 RepID=UPI0010201FD3|nr:polyhydroxyalkanoate synthesis repressor PhaR [Qipengyuania thermophila]TCD05192.1 polyhydroxyalkanoate synthesis repressor PhaR [Erythrobacteraceae bacterium CFH 75059]
MAKRQAGDGPVIIKKYANRRLYNTGSSTYITLDDLATMVRQNVDFKVVDAKTGDDLTHAILTQIIMEKEAGQGEPMLSVPFLRELIAMYGHSVQALMPAYLTTMMQQFRENQEKLGEAFGMGQGAAALAKMTETNLAMMRAAGRAFMPPLGGAAGSTGAGKAPASPKAEPPSRDDDLAALKAQLASMQKRLDELDR